MNPIIILLKIISPHIPNKILKKSFDLARNKEYLSSSEKRLEQIKKSLLLRESCEVSKIWECVRFELKYVDRQIKTNSNFKLSKYLKKNFFMGKLIQTQIDADNIIDEILNKKRVSS